MYTKTINQMLYFEDLRLPFVCHLWSHIRYILRNVETSVKITTTPSYLIWWGWSGGAMVLGKLSVPGPLTNLDNVVQGPIALVVGAGGGCLDIFTLSLGDGPI